MQTHLNFNFSYLALIVVAALHAPQAFAEAQQEASNNEVTLTEQVEHANETLINPDVIINLETLDDSKAHGAESYEDSQMDTGAINPVEDMSNFYSDIEMRMQLAMKADAEPCSADTCKDNQAFDSRVKLIGESLAESSYALYPELKTITPKFEFDVVNKKALGTASNANGKVILFRSIQQLDLDDNAIAFIIGREMGHVIGKHHKSNAKTKILFTVLTSVLFPAAALLGASSAAAQATTATTLMTSAASTVTSLVGSEVALSRIKPGQLSEADNISLAILEYGGVTVLDAAQSLEFIVKNERSVGWEKDLNLSIENVRRLAGEPQEILTELEPLPEVLEEANTYMIDQAVTVADNIENQITQ